MTMFKELIYFDNQLARAQLAGVQWVALVPLMCMSKPFWTW